MNTKLMSIFDWKSTEVASSAYMTHADNGSDKARQDPHPCQHTSATPLYACVHNGQGPLNQIALVN